ncbi:MAG: trypsin-like peptidase domain-containing protein [Phycisphaerales bacterium]
MRRFVAFGPAFVVLLACVVTLLVAPAILRQHATATTRAQIVLARQTLDEDDILARVDAAIAAVADSVMPSVVHIQTTGKSASGWHDFGSSGAGWVFDTDGHVITNAHVIRNAGSISVEFFDGTVSNATLVGVDPYTDIAVLAVSGSGPYYPATLADDHLPRQGERAFAFGSPFGFKFSMSEGIVSGLGREPPGGLGNFTNYIQTDAAVNPGNSGGPLVNVRGAVIGMNVAIATARNSGSTLEDDNSGDSAGISFAIPLGTIEPIVGQLLDHGEVQRGFIGVSFANPSNRNDTAVRRFFSSDGELVTGVQIFEVTAGGPSQRAGLLAGDIIVGVRNQPVLGVSGLRTLVSSTRPGEPVPVDVYRDDEIKHFTVTLDRMPNELLTGATGRQLSFQLGLFVTNSDSGPFVHSVYPGGLADRAGFATGQRILRVAGREVADDTAFFAALADAGLLTGRQVEVEVREEDEEGQVSTRTIRVGLY